MSPRPATHHGQILAKGPRPMNPYLGYIAVWPGDENQFVAQAVGFPDLKAEGVTESEAVEKVRDSLTQFLANAKLVKYASDRENPWLKAFGSSADDPDFDIYLEEIRKARLEADQVGRVPGLAIEDWSIG